MQRTVIVGLYLIAMVGSTALAQTAVNDLASVKTIYVGDFGHGPGSELIRSKIITGLVKSHRIAVVETESGADAILTGVGELSKTAHFSIDNGSGSGGSRYHATAGVRLLNQEQKILWADEASNGWFYRSASSSVAEKIVKALLKALGK